MSEIENIGVFASSLYSPDAFTPSAYTNSYGKLRLWIEESLDVFKNELWEILFPLFQHTYFDLIARGMIVEAREFFTRYKDDHHMHEHDVINIEMVSTPDQLRENDYANLNRSTKYQLKMAPTKFQLLVSYLEENKMVAMLRIINTYINIDVSQRSAVVSDSFNQRFKLSLGMQPMEQQATLMIEAALKEESAVMLDAFKQMNIPEGTSNIPMPPVNEKTVLELVENLRDLVSRTSLNPTLPSCCFYTWHNTWDSLTCSSISKNYEIVAGGFSDSVVRVCSLTKENLKSVTPRAGMTAEDISQLTMEQIMVMKEKEGSATKKLVGHSGPVYGTSFSNDDRFLLSCSEDQTVRLWSLDTFTSLCCYRGHGYPVWDVDFGPEGVYFATSSHDRTARLWSCEHIYPLRVFAGHFSDVETVKFHPNSCYLATGSSDKTVRLWDLAQGNCVRVFSGNNPVQTLCFSPDGTKLATADDKYVHLWDIASGEQLKKFSGHKSLVTSLCFSAEGSILASGSLDCTIRLWDVLKQQELELERKRKKKSLDDLLLTLNTKRTPVFNVQFTRRNLLLGTGPFCPE